MLQQEKSHVRKVRLAALGAGLLASLLMPVGSTAFAAEQSPTFERVHLDKIRAGEHTGFVRVVFDLDGPASWKIIETGNTVVLEFTQFQSSGSQKIFDDMGTLRNIEITPVGNDTARVSFDIDGPARARVSNYEPDYYGGHRIVVDLWPTARQPSQDEGFITAEASPWPEESPSGDIAAPASQTVAVPGLKLTRAAAPEQEPSASGILNASVTKDPLLAARARLARDDPAGACDILQRNFPRGTWNIEAMVEEGKCLHALGQTTDAADVFTQVLSFDPDHLRARFGLANAQLGRGDLNAARDNYTRLLAALEPGEQATGVKRQLQVVQDKLDRGLN